MEVNNNHEKMNNISEFLSLKTLLPPCLPEAGSEFEVTVSYAVSPDNFVILPETGGGGGNYEVAQCWCCMLSLSCSAFPHSLPGLPELTGSMMEYYEAGPGQHQRLGDSRLDRFAAAKLNNTDWHR